MTSGASEYVHREQDVCNTYHLYIYISMYIHVDTFFFFHMYNVKQYTLHQSYHSSVRQRQGISL